MGMIVSAAFTPDSSMAAVHQSDAVLTEVTDWQNRALEPMYPVVFLDALRVKIRDVESHQVKSKSVCVALGVASESESEVLELWVANNEAAKF
jgi:putative transposase